MAISSPGIGSNLDVASIVTQLMAIERQPLTTLDTKEASFQAQLSGYGSLRGALSTLKTAVDSLEDGSRFRGFSATAGDTDILSASAATGALAGTYSVEVDQLAQRQSLVAAGQGSRTAAIGTGADTTISIQVGSITGGTLTNGVYSGAAFTAKAGTTPATLTINTGNNSLQGIRDAINSANAGVTASIVKDGTASPYRLVLQSTNTGAANAVKISVTGDAAITSLLAYDPAGAQNLTQTSEARDAQLSVNGIDVTSASNAVADVLDGVTLNLAKVGTTTVTVARSTTTAVQGVQDFVKAYNDFSKTLTDLTRFDASSGQGGVLLGDSAARTIQSQLRATLAAALPGAAAGELRNLSQVGLTFQRDGTLAFDQTKLTAALNSNAEAVVRLFASGSKADDAQISIASVGARTLPGTYRVIVDTLPLQGRVVGETPAALVIDAGVNDALSITVDGTTASVTLPAGTYTAATLAAQVQSTINASATLIAAGARVSVSQTGGVLTLTSQRYGATSAVATSGTGAVAILGANPAVFPGVDVAGSLSGVAGTGAGQRLTAAIGSPADGIAVDITGGTVGDRGNVTVSTGLAGRLNDLLDRMLATDGALSARTEGISRSIKDLDRQRETLNRRLDGVERRYREQFTALDTMMSSMLATSNFLTQQLAALNNTNNQ